MSNKEDESFKLWIWEVARAKEEWRKETGEPEDKRAIDYLFGSPKYPKFPLKKDKDER